MDVRQPDSIDEYRKGERIIADAWRDAFGDIVSEEAIERVETAASGSGLAERYRRVTDDDSQLALIALMEDQVVGTASMAWGSDSTNRFVEPDEAELVTLYVDPERWSEGIGTELIDEVFHRLPASTDRLLLQTFVENEQGRAFYESRGFETVETWTFEIADESYPTVVYARTVPDDPHDR